MGLLDLYGTPGMNEAWGGQSTTAGVGSMMQRQMQGLRALRYLRPYSQSIHASRGMPNNNPFIAPQGTSGLDAYTYDPDLNAQAKTALAPYGERPLDPSEVNPYAVIPNNPFFQRHQKLGGFLDNFLTGAANTQGSDTWGEGISNVARGLIQGKQMHQQMLEQQFAAPFQRAQMLEGMQAKQQTIDTGAAHEAYWNAMANKANNPTPKPTQYKHFYPQGQADGSVHLMGIMSDGSHTDEGPMYTKPSQTPGLAPYVGFFKARGVDPDSATDAQWQRALSDKEKYDTNVASGKRNAVINANATNPNAPAQPEPPEVKTARAQMQNELKTFNSPAYRKQASVDIVQDQVASGQPIKLPTSADIDAHINKKKQASQANFNKFYDSYQAANPKANTPKRLVNYNPETQDFEPIPSEDDDQ